MRLIRISALDQPAANLSDRLLKVADDATEVITEATRTEYNAVQAANWALKTKQTWVSSVKKKMQVEKAKERVGEGNHILRGV